MSRVLQTGHLLHDVLVQVLWVERHSLVKHDFQTIEERPLLRPINNNYLIVRNEEVLLLKLVLEVV